MTQPLTPKATILVVDDFEDIRTALRLVLEGRGYTVLEAQDGHEAVKAARVGRPALILMDLFMPKQDGFAAAREIHAEAELRGVPIVAVSAYGELGIEDHLQMKARVAGFSAYVTKPFEPQGLLEIVEGLLSASD